MTTNKPSRRNFWISSCALALPVYLIVIVGQQTGDKTVTPVGWILGYLMFVLFSAAFLAAVRSVFNKNPTPSTVRATPVVIFRTAKSSQATVSVFDHFVDVLAEGKRSLTGYIPQVGPLVDAGAVRNAIIGEFQKEQNSSPERAELFASVYGDTAWLALPLEIERHESIGSLANLAADDNFSDHRKSEALLQSVTETQRLNSRTLELRAEFRTKARELA